MAPPTLVVLAPHTATPLFTAVGRKPPWNQPQLMPLAFSKSPMFWPLTVMLLALGEEQSSSAGLGSPITVPLATLKDADAEAPWVWPEIRLRAPGVEGPKVVPKELSLNAKFWA